MEYVEFKGDNPPAVLLKKEKWPDELEVQILSGNFLEWVGSSVAGFCNRGVSGLVSNMLYRVPADLARVTEPEPKQTKAERLLGGLLFDSDDIDFAIKEDAVTFGAGRDIDHAEALRLGHWLVDMLGAGE